MAMTMKPWLKLDNSSPRLSLAGLRTFALPSVSTLGFVLVLIISFVLFDTSLASEPLRGPELGSLTWIGQDSVNPDQHYFMRERFLDSDVPIPIPLWIAMPFATVRFKDRTVENEPRYSSDQKLGIGFLHHAAEGDPSWRLEVIRGGPMKKEPSTRTRFITSLVKPFPWMRIRPSDKILSWIGMNYVTRKNQKPFIIPELAWYREGREGLIIDLHAPRHFIMGVRGQFFGLDAGLEQDWTHWETVDGDSKDEEWMLNRISRLRLSFFPMPELTFTASVLHDLAKTNTRKNIGTKLAVQWTPNP